MIALGNCQKLWIINTLDKSAKYSFFCCSQRAVFSILADLSDVGINVSDISVAVAKIQKAPGVCSIDHRNMRDVLAALFGEERKAERVLIVIREQPPLERVADGLPALVVLVIDLSPCNIAVLIDEQDRAVFVIRDNTAGSRIIVQQPPDRVNEPGRCLETAVREQVGME